MTPEAIHQASISVLEAQGYFPASGSKDGSTPLKLFDMALALHVSSPKLEAYYQYYNSRHLDTVSIPSGYLVEECGSWVDWYGARLCSGDDLLGVLGREALEGSDAARYVVLFDLLTVMNMRCFKGQIQTEASDTSI